MPDPGEQEQVQDCTSRGYNEHGDAQRVAVERQQREIDAGGGQGREPDGHANAADGEYGCAKALQQRKNETGSG